jgi:hypothetical protein
MFRTILFTVVICILSSHVVFAQFTQTVRGKVIDKVTSSPIPGVNVI